MLCPNMMEGGVLVGHVGVLEPLMEVRGSLINLIYTMCQPIPGQ